MMPFAPIARAEDGIHVVTRGDNLSQIAKAYDVSVQELIIHNGITNPNIVHTGQRLVIPGTRAARTAVVQMNLNELPAGDGYYTVQRGDTLSQIAARHGATMWDVMRLNGIGSPHLISVGQKLRVSARVSAPSPETEPKLKLADSIYIVQVGDTLSQIAKDHNLTKEALMVANGIPHENFVWIGQRLRIRQNAKPEAGFNLADAPEDGYRRIEVNLSDQTLTAWQGDVPVLHTNVSTGTWKTPTVTGRYPVYMKLQSQTMSGSDYHLPNVPWVMYFHQGYAIHGTYWHNNFGTPMSHGCVNMRIDEAKFLYSWAAQGTEVFCSSLIFDYSDFGILALWEFMWLTKAGKISAG
ncbi:LysM peptidoglycan-binding domain-containing protein [Chloroflexi bacterium TSY]|nr:LysM peptidoglycan-binding domain-containing protein [Chloroflexi bacterium TSY]